MKKIGSLVVLLIAVLTVGMIVRSAVDHRVSVVHEYASSEVIAPDLIKVIQEADAYFAEDWKLHELQPAEVADERLIFRRLSLGLMGTIPSLEELRVFNNDTTPNKIERWLERMLNDPRFHSYLAERLARSYVGTEVTPFIIFRRDQFTGWLAEEVKKNRPYDDIVKQMITGIGVWTDKPEVNFITQTVNNERVDQNTLAGRTVRAFLGQRIDCAQCHDHPFAAWKQQDFEGLAAYYGRTKISVAGITEKKRGEYQVEDRLTLEKRNVAPRVPFKPEWLNNNENRRVQLAHWITHPENRRFERAIVNRLWAIMFGRPWSQGAPYQVAVDDLPDPPDLEQGEAKDLLDILGADFRKHNCDLRRTIKVIAGLKVFRQASVPANSQFEGITDNESKHKYNSVLEDHWGVFPLIRLRPEQVVGSMLQASSIQTIDMNSHLLTRVIRFLREKDFINEYGDFGAEEFLERSATIPQGLLTMNGKLVSELVDDNPLSATLRIAALSPDDHHCLETCYLVCLSRKPTKYEEEMFLPQLAEVRKTQRSKWVEDFFWTLFNSPEFSWNH